MLDFAAARRMMVDCQVRTSDVTDLRLIAAMLSVPRERFVPKASAELAYLDTDLLVGAGARALIKPMVLAKLLQAAEIKETDRVLVVGCASGYAAAVIARFAPHVSGTESDAALAAKARANLAGIGCGNISIQAAAAGDGEPAEAPYDVIVLNGATEIVPERLYAQLRDGGRLVGVFATSQPARATIVTCSHGDFGHRTLFDAAAPVLPGLERAAAFVF